MQNSDLRGSGQKSLQGNWPKQLGNSLRTGLTWGHLLLCYITNATCQGTGVHQSAIFSNFFSVSEQQGPTGRELHPSLGVSVANAASTWLAQPCQGGTQYSGNHHTTLNSERAGTAERPTSLPRIWLRLLGLLLARLSLRWGNLWITRLSTASAEDKDYCYRNRGSWTTLLLHLRFLVLPFLHLPLAHSPFPLPVLTEAATQFLGLMFLILIPISLILYPCNRSMLVPPNYRKVCHSKLISSP